MLLIALIALVVLWALRYVHPSGLVVPDIGVFAINRHTVTLLELGIFVVSVSSVAILPSPLRQIGAALVVLWALAITGTIPIAGLSSLVVLAIAVTLVAALIARQRIPEPI